MKNICFCIFVSLVGIVACSKKSILPEANSTSSALPDGWYVADNENGPGFLSRLRSDWFMMNGGLCMRANYILVKPDLTAKTRSFEPFGFGNPTEYEGKFVLNEDVSLDECEAGNSFRITGMYSGFRFDELRSALNNPKRIIRRDGKTLAEILGLKEFSDDMLLEAINEITFYEDPSSGKATLFINIANIGEIKGNRKVWIWFAYSDLSVIDFQIGSLKTNMENDAHNIGYP